MKKYLTPIIILGIVGAGIYIRSVIVAPARALALDLAAINGITVGKTTEAELLGRSAFQTLDRRCFGADCDYHVERENSFLSQLHLAPHIFVGTSVGVRDGMVTRVSTFMTTQGLTPMVISQKETLPPDCASNPCMKRFVLPTKVTGTSWSCLTMIPNYATACRK